MLAEDADATITLTRETFNDIILQRLTREDAITSGVVTIDGNSTQAPAIGISPIRGWRCYDVRDARYRPSKKYTLKG